MMKFSEKIIVILINVLKNKKGGRGSGIRGYVRSTREFPSLKSIARGREREREHSSKQIEY